MKKIFTVLTTMLFLIFSNNAFSQTIDMVTVSPSILTDCSNTSVDVNATQLCMNYLYNGSSHTITGNTITVSLNWQTQSFICLGALVFVSENEQLGQVPAGTYTLDVVTLLDGVIQNTNSQQINITPCCVVSTSIPQPVNDICLGEGATLTGTATNAISSYWSQNGVVLSSADTLAVQPTSPGAYTYYYVATDGNCSDSTAHVLQVNDFPPIDLGVDTAVCIGQSIVLTATGGATGATYLWSSGTTGINYTVNTPGTYSVVVSNNGCTGSDSVVVSSLNTPTFNLGSDTTLCDGSTITLDATAATSGVTYAWAGGSTMPMLTVNTAGNYQVTATNSSGCSFTDDITISYDGIPMPNLGNDTTLCAGASITLDGSTTVFGFINWNTGASDPFVTVDSAGTYTITVTTDGGCVGTDDIVVDYSSVNVDFGGDTLDLVNVNPMTLDAGNAGGTYLWNTGETTQTIDIDTEGTYDVTVTDMFGCVASSSVVIVNTTSTTGLMNENFKVYPNPANQYIVVEAKGTEVSMARIINITGQVVGMVNVQNQEQISVEHLSNGVYFLQFSNRNGEVVGQTKFVKQ
ncbi:MAG: T9SS type A sorting domain-containing protein [Saprospiraceae bacterium]